MSEEQIIVHVRIEDGVVTLLEKGAGVRVIIDDIDTEAEMRQITRIYPPKCVIENGEDVEEPEEEIATDESRSYGPNHEAIVRLMKEREED